METPSKKMKLQHDPSQTILNIQMMREQINTIKQTIGSYSKDMVELIASEAKRLESELSSLAAAIEAQKKKDQPDIQLFEKMLHNGEKLAELSGSNTFLNLALASSSFHKLLSPVISSKFTFLNRPIGDSQFNVYKPKKIKFASCILPILENMIPPQATHLSFGRLFNNTIDHLPNSVTHLTFGDEFNHPVDHLPNSIVHIAFGQAFNREVDHLPPSLKYLQFGNQFNQSIDKLPPSLKELSLAMCFGQSVDKLPNLECLLIAGQFNSSIDRLPQTLTKLCLSGEFNQPLPALPRLIHLEIGSTGFNQSLDHLPASLVTLRFWSEENVAIPFLPSLNELMCSGESIPQISKSLTSLELLDPCPANVLDKLADSSIACLKLSEMFNGPLNNLPRTLKKLSLDIEFNHPLDALPDSLTHLEFKEYSNFSHSLDQLPKSLTHLLLVPCFQHPFNNIPPNLTHVSFSKHADCEVVKGTFPPTLKNLEIGSEYFKTPRCLPPSLENLIVSIYTSSRTTEKIPNIKLPPTLSVVKVKSYINDDGVKEGAAVTFDVSC